MTGAAQGAVSTRGRGQRGAWRRPPAVCLDAQTAPACVSAPFPSVAVTHELSFPSFRRSPYIIGTMNQATSSTPNLQLHHNFR